jgi:hypothetical protein
MISRVAPAILAAMLLAISASAQEQVNSKVEVGVAGGLWDNGLFKDAESFVQPSLTLAMQSEELTLEFRGRGLFTQDDSNQVSGTDVDGHSRYYDARGLLGWSFPLGSINRLDVLAGLGYRDTTVLYTGAKTVWRLTHADVGLRHGISLGERFEVVTEAVCGMIVAGEQTDHDPGVGDTSSQLENGFVGEARTAVNWYFTKKIALQVGAAYEYSRFRPDGITWEFTESHLWSVGLGMVFKF